MGDVVLLTARKGASHGVGAEEGGADGHRRRLGDTRYHAQHFQLVGESEAVAALYLYRAGALAHDFVGAGHGLCEKLVLGRLVQQVGAVEYAASACGNLFVAQAFDFVAELAVAAPGKDNVRV